MKLHLKMTFYAYLSWIRPISVDRWSTILLASSFSRQDASNDTHDDPNGPTLQFDPSDSQGHHMSMDTITCGVTPPKWAVLPEGCQFSENLLYIVA